MKIIVDVSLYPLTKDYIPPIDDVIERFNAWPDVEVSTNRLSTQLIGDYDNVMQLLKTEVLTSLCAEHQCVFVTKILRADSNPE